MDNTIALLAFGTFGNPNGFKQSFFLGASNEFKNIKTFDLNTNAIKTFPNTHIYAIRKEILGLQTLISYSLYHYAKEPNSDRSGAFIGSSILFQNKIAEESLTLAKLNEIQNFILSNNLKEDVIQTSHSDNLTIIKPKNWEKLSFGTQDVPNFEYTQKNLVIYCQTSPGNLVKLLKDAVQLLEVYDTIYFTESQEIATYVHEKNIFKLIEQSGFASEVKLMISDKNNKKKVIVDRIKSEQLKIENKKVLEFDKFKKHIAAQELKVKEATLELKKAEENFGKFQKKYENLNNSLNKLLSKANTQNYKSEDVEKELLTIYESFNKKKDLTPEIETEEEILIENPVKAKSKSNWISLSIIGVLISGIAYLYYTTDVEIKKLKSDLSKIDTTQKVEIPKLVPEPNAKLSEADLQIISQKLQINMPLDQVVHTIFEVNPSEIAKVYNFQKDVYKQFLIDNNPGYFAISDSSTLLLNPALIYIPIFKTPLENN